MRISDWSSDVCSSDLAASECSGTHYPQRRRWRAYSAAISGEGVLRSQIGTVAILTPFRRSATIRTRSEEHTSELQSLMRISYAVFCLKKKNNTNQQRSKRTKIHINTQI